MKQPWYRAMLFVVLCSASFIPMLASASTATGRILLQVEERGEAWYVDPLTLQRVYVTDGEAAFAALRTFGLGITNEHIAKIPVGLTNTWSATDTDHDGLQDVLEESLGTSSIDADSDDDGYGDWAEISGGYNPVGSGRVTFDSTLAHNLSGRILLQVEERGQAWYVNPVDEKRYYMANGEAAFAIMKSLGLGITNANLSSIPVYTGTLNCGTSFTCLASGIQANVSVNGTQTISTDNSSGTIQMNIEMSQDATTTLEKAFITKITTQGREKFDGYLVTATCTYTDVDAMVAMLKRWSQGSTTSHTSASFSDDGSVVTINEGDPFDFATCSTSVLDATGKEVGSYGL